MNHTTLRTTLLLSAVLAVSACKKSSESEPPAAAPSKPVAAAPEPPKPPPGPPPVGDFTLSFLEEAAGGKCKWMRLEKPGATPRAVFSFDSPCHSASLSWSQDGRKGAVLQQGDGGAQASRAWTVDLVEGKGEAVPLPEQGRTEVLGFDAQGALVALASHEEGEGSGIQREDGESGVVLIHEGQRYPLQINEGILGLAYGYRREEGKWKRVETKATTYGWDLAEGVEALEVSQKLGPATRLRDRQRVETTELPAEDVKRLGVSEETPEDSEGRIWMQVKTPGGRLVFREEVTDFVLRSPPLLWEKDGKWEAPPQLTLAEDGFFDLWVRGDAVLILSGKATHLYDAKQHKRVFAHESASVVGFWPQPVAEAAASGAQTNTP
jgi:hypothetical protein